MDKVIMLRCECGCGQLFPKEEMEKISIKIIKSKSHNVRIVSDNAQELAKPEPIKVQEIKPVPMPGIDGPKNVIPEGMTPEEMILAMKEKGKIEEPNVSIEGKHEPRPTNKGGGFAPAIKKSPIPPGFNSLAISREDPRFESLGAKETRSIH